MSRWKDLDWRGAADLLAVVLAFVLVGGVAHVLTGREVGATIAGAALGFLVGEGGRWRRDRLQDRWVRRALRLEFAQNLYALGVDWSELTALRGQFGHNADLSHARSLMNAFPTWNQTLWSSQVGHLGTALKDVEITAAMHMQTDYERLVMLRNRMMPFLEREDVPSQIDETLWQATDRLVSIMLERGNPIGTRP
jgi:hypothetical protein